MILLCFRQAMFKSSVCAKISYIKNMVYLLNYNYETQINYWNKK